MHIRFRMHGRVMRSRPVDSPPPSALLSPNISASSPLVTGGRKGASWLPSRILRAVWGENRGFLLDRAIFSKVRNFVVGVFANLWDIIRDS